MHKKSLIAAVFILALSVSMVKTGGTAAEYALPNFVECQKNPVVVPPGGFFYYSPDVLIENPNLWYMLFGGQTPDAAANGDAIYVASSTDGGNTWNQNGGGSMVLPDGPSGSWNDAHSNDPSWVKVNGTYYMVFTGAYGPGGNETDQIGLATSTDPLRGWTEYSGNPILAEGFSYDEYYPARPTLLYEDGVFKMWYDCRATPYNYGSPPAVFTGIAYATSEDGLNWTRHGLVITSSSGLGGPSVYRQDNDTLVMVAEEPTGIRHFNWYTSSDGLSWVYRSQVVDPFAPWHIVNGVSSADVLKDNDGQWIIYFAGGNGTIGYSWRIGFAYVSTIKELINPLPPYLSPPSPPAITISSLENKTYAVSSVFLNLTVAMLENDAEISSVRCYLDGDANSLNSHEFNSSSLAFWNWSTALTGLSDGTHTLQVDAAGRNYTTYSSVISIDSHNGTYLLENSTAYSDAVWSHSEISFTVDTTPPRISILSPQNKTYYSNDIPFSFTVNEPVTWVGYSLDGQTNVTIDENVTLNSLAYGSHSLTFFATDAVGNTGASEIIHFSIFPTTWVAAAVVIVTAAIAAPVLIVYFKKRKRQA